MKPLIWPNHLVFTNPSMLWRKRQTFTSPAQLGGRGRTCTCEGETPLDLQSSAFAAQPHAQYQNNNKILQIIQ